jgi:hypothetical protein
MNDDDGMDIRSYGCSTVSKFLDDFIVYRGLNPCDRRLPNYAECRSAVGLQQGGLPRKHEEDYARIVVHLLRSARRQSLPEARIRRLIYLGDTRLSDATAYQNLCRAGNWAGLAFICSEDSRSPAALLSEGEKERCIYTSNRWALLSEFDRQRKAQNIPVDEETVVVVDLDKTAIGARGRNAGVIDQARQLAVQQTVADLLREAFDPGLFQQAYAVLNKPEFHSFTEDNQDYVAYVCLAIGNGRYRLEDTLAEIHAGSLLTFDQFISRIDKDSSELPERFRVLHADFYTKMQAGDPTPFKEFRRNEYLITAGRMGCLPRDTPPAQILAKEIAITWEVHQIALNWKASGALIFGLSDKPDEASLPTPEQVAKGSLPLHRIETHLVSAS